MSHASATADGIDMDEFTNVRTLGVSLVLHRPEWIPLPNETDADRRKREYIKRQKRAAQKQAVAAKAASAAEAGEEEEDGTAEAASQDETPYVDVANILRGGYPKARFLAEPSDTGMGALGMLGKTELDFCVVPLEIPEAFVKSVSSETEWTVLGGKHGARAKMTQMSKLLRRKDQELSELEAMLNSATGSIQQFHLQQKQLFDEFVSLRSTYDNTKVKLREAIWIHAAKMSREFTVIPPLLRSAIEDGSQIEQYALGGVIGKGESSIVKSCKIGSSRSKKGSGGAQSSRPSGGVSRSGLAKRDLAVKIINKNRVQDVASLQRVANEIRVLREASNVNIMALYDVIHTERQLYMVMERGDRDLFTVIMEADRADRTGKAGGRVEESLVREIIQQVLSGVAYIHGMHVCHRDLKPENIVLVEKPGTPKPVVKIIDFGSCAATAGGPTLLDLCGTPGFLPPEMIMEDSYDGFLGDMWSIGAIALEMVLGHKLFSEIWLPAYAEELVGSRKAFAMQMADTVPRMRSALGKRVKQKLASAASLEAICAALMVNPRKRIVVDNLFVHRWVGGKRERAAGGGRAAAKNSGKEGGAEDAEPGTMRDASSGEKATVSSAAAASEESSKSEGREPGTTTRSLSEGKCGAIGELKEEEMVRGGVVGEGGSASASIVRGGGKANLPKITTLQTEGQSKQMRRSASMDDLKSAGGIARGLVNPERSPRRLPPLEGGGETGSGGRGREAKQTSGEPKSKLGVDTVLANKIRESDSVSRVEEPGSPAIGDAQRIVNQGDAILHNWVRGGGTVGGEGKVGASKSGAEGEENGKPRDRSPLVPK